MITQNVYYAAYAKARGAELGLVIKGDNGSANIELLITEEEFNKYVDEYNKGSLVEARLFADELGYIRYLARQRCSK